MVFVRLKYALRLSTNIWFHHDDASIVYQLQTEVRGPSTVANDDLQIFKYIHR